MNPSPEVSRRANTLLQLGVALFLLGLLTGYGVPFFANPRMGLASHLEGIMNGMFLILLGLLWTRLVLSPRRRAWLFGLALFGTVANWTATLLAALWNAGASMPIAAPDRRGTPVQEVILDTLLLSLSLAMVAVCVLLLLGLRSPAAPEGPDGR